MARIAGLAVVAVILLVAALLAFELADLLEDSVRHLR